MTISFVGSNTQARNDGSAISMSLPATVQNDLVVVFTACRDETKGGSPIGGYTQIADLLFTGATALRLHASYKFMGAIQDTLVGVAGTGSATVGTNALALVFRDVSRTTALDVAVTTAETTGVPISPSVTPVNNDCCIIIAAASVVRDLGVGGVSSYLPNPSVQIAGTASSGVSDITVASAYRILSGAGAQTPTAWSTWSVGNYISISIALRPLTIETDLITVNKATVTVTGKAVAERQTHPVSRATVTYTGKTIATPDGLVQSIFIDPAMDIMLTGKAVNSTETFRAVTVEKASVLYRGRTVTPREIQFEDIPRYAVKGRGSGHWMETR